MRKSRAKVLSAAIFVLVVAASYSAGKAIADEKFYGGKTVRVVVMSPPGGFFDLWARLLARHMGRHIPGNPSMIVQNMPGGGGVIAANYLYGVAKPDGLTFGTVIGSMYLPQLARLPGVEFNWPEFTFIGRTRGDVHVFYIRSDLPYQTWRDLRVAKEPIPVGASGRGTGTYIAPKVMQEVLGLNLRVIAGYPGGAPIDAAMERGEVAGSARGASVYLGREPYLTWHTKEFVRAIAQTARQRDSRLPDVPTVWEIAAELGVPEADVKFMETAYKGGDEWYWLYMAPPGVPTERVRILREAFHKALDDPRLRDEGAKMGLFPGPVDPDELQQAAAEVMRVDAKTAERIKNLLGG